METKLALGVLFVLSLLLIEGTEGGTFCTENDSRTVNA